MQFWLRLKPDLLPCIAQEVDKVTQDYIRLIDRFRRGDRSSVQEILLLQASIKSRIEEFDQFYEKFFNDYRIGYFEKLKLRLRKLLYTPIEAPVIDDQPQKIYEVRRTEESEESKRGDPYSKGSARSPYVEKKEVKSSRSDLKSSARDKSPMTTSQNIQVSSSNKTPQKVSSSRPGTASQTKKSVPSLNQSSNIQNLERSQNNTTNTTQGEGEDVVFTIKMSKQEYLQYLQARKTTGQK